MWMYIGMVLRAVAARMPEIAPYTLRAPELVSQFYISRLYFETYVDIESESKGENIFERDRPGQCFPRLVAITIVDIGNYAGGTELCTECKYTETQNDRHRPWLSEGDGGTESAEAGNCENEVGDHDNQTEFRFVHSIVESRHPRSQVITQPLR